MSIESAPTPIANWLTQLPGECVGKLYAKIRPPFCPFGFWFRVGGWGQLCDGRDHRDMVHLMLHNYFPARGRGWTYVAWRAEPDSPGRNAHPRNGTVADPKPYSGIAYDQRSRIAAP
jgi:hypothetical protein